MSTRPSELLLYVSLFSCHVNLSSTQQNNCMIKFIEVENQWQAESISINSARVVLDSRCLTGGIIPPYDEW